MASSIGTNFVSSGGLPAVQSLNPCHIYGDADLYGLGIRLSFYLQYAAAAVALEFEAQTDFRVWRAAFMSVAVATFIALCRNTAGSVGGGGGVVVILDWTIMTLLVFLFPIFFALPVFSGIIHHTDARYRSQSARWLAQRAEQAAADFKDGLHRVVFAGHNEVQHAYAELQRAADQVMRVFHVLTGHHRGVTNRVADDEVREQATRLEVPLARYRRAVASDLANTNAEALVPAGPDGQHAAVVATVLDEDFVRNLGRDLDGLRDFVQTLPQQHRSILHAMGVGGLRAQPYVGAAVRGVDQLEFLATQSLNAFESVLRRLEGLGQLDKVSGGIGFLVCAAYCFTTPWLYFDAIYRGSKLPDCPVYAVVFTPVSIYAASFITFLKVFACLLIIFGLFFVVVGLALVFLGLLDSCLPQNTKNTGNSGGGEGQGGERTQASRPESAVAPLKISIRSAAINRHCWLARMEWSRRGPPV